MNRLLHATHFATCKHRGQFRKDPCRTPYIHHPVEVAFHLSRVGGVEDEEVLMAAVLHDTIEDTSTTQAELMELFGGKVAGLVMECTDDKRLPKAERKRLQIVNAPGKSPEAKQIKIADTSCNLRDILTAAPVGWALDRQRDYFHWAGQVMAGLFGVNDWLDREARKVLREGLARLTP